MRAGANPSPATAALLQTVHEQVREGVAAGWLSHVRGARR
jgi:hypothetical protein